MGIYLYICLNKETGEFGGLTDPMAAAAIFLPLEPNAIGI